ncbi:hypothetical protein TOK_0112 [Pseudonocardia sp. N23]|nr:hypothetical protein TOK_0112 [Pseudonocardia sp. N23]
MAIPSRRTSGRGTDVRVLVVRGRASPSACPPCQWPAVGAPRFRGHP